MEMGFGTPALTMQVRGTPEVVGIKKRTDFSKIINIRYIMETVYLHVEW